ncbi:MAG: TonB-dependent receptor [Bacteroidota bacterium]|nr:TonB-dependent receptor [Bacteroidota bacterium]
MKNKSCAKILFAAMLTTTLNVNSQNIISGRIKSISGEPVSFATIGIRNSQLNTISNAEGVFTFNNIKNGTYIIDIKCLGFESKTDTVLIASNISYSPILNTSNKELDEVVVNATRVNKSSGMAFNNIDVLTLKQQNLGQDAPYMLNQLPSVVINSDAGNGVGYTGMRIRGSDGTRINVTINGVPVNDAESQGTFFVNMPDIVSSTNNIQVQRGVGASSNGSGAFGASVNFQTNQLQDKPYANAISTAGSFGTFRNTLAAGTGLLNNKFTLDARASNISSNGYIDRAKSNLQSYYIAAGYYGKKSVLKFINFLGQEKTYQAWYYVNEDSIKKGNRTDNPAGLYYDANGKPQYYKNETDNYKQNNFQLHFIHTLNSKLSFNITGHYTKGAGYYEQYRQGELFSTYKLQDVITPKGDTISKTDLIRRLWLDNDFAGGLFNVNYTINSKLQFTLGGGYNSYFGKHYNRVMWANYASNSSIDYEYNYNSANKNDGNMYLKTNFKPINHLNVFVDLQMRKVDYRYFGFNDTLAQQMQNVSYNFFNPKMGLSYDVNSKINVYVSVAFANKEPNRDDFVQSSPKSRPKHEQLVDLETGINYTYKKVYIAANFYNMQYTNQLVLNGQVNNVGAYNRVNVASSYRRGIELEFNANINKYFSVGGNITLSQNKIEKFTEYLDSSSADYSVYLQRQNTYNNTDISFSPNIISSANLAITPIKNMQIVIINKYVGTQYLDNTTNLKRSINPYNTIDVRINYSIKTRVIPEISFTLAIYNVLNTKYETNGYTYSYYYDSASLSTFNFKAPAAPTNFLGGVSFKF